MRPPRAALVAALLVTSGCLGVFGPSRPPSDERAVDAVDRSRAALAEVTAYRTTVDGSLVATSDDERVTVDVSGTVAVNASTRRMNGTARFDDPPSSFQDSTQQTYVDNYTAYSECARLGWERRTLSAARSWHSYTPAGEQLALLNATDVYWRGTEPVDGTEAAVVVASPTADELQSAPRLRSVGSDVTDANVENVTVTVWLDTETDLPVKARREVEVAKRGATATVTVTFRFTDYDEPTPVTGPNLAEKNFWNSGCPGS